MRKKRDICDNQNGMKYIKFEVFPNQKYNLITLKDQKKNNVQIVKDYMFNKTCLMYADQI